MISLIMMFIIILLVTLLITLLSIILAKKSISNREKSSPFECGFDPFSSSRMPFSIHFFMIAIIFLIFDVEIALLLPMILTLFKSNMMNWSLTIYIFISILLMGLYHEWKLGALNWNN